MQQDINYKKWFLIKKRAFFKNKLAESIGGKPKDLWKTLKPLGLPNKVSSCEVKALKIIIQLNTMLAQC